MAAGFMGELVEPLIRLAVRCFARSKQLPLPLGDNFDVSVSHFDGGIVVANFSSLSIISFKACCIQVISSLLRVFAFEWNLEY